MPLENFYRKSKDTYQRPAEQAERGSSSSRSNPLLWTQRPHGLSEQSSQMSRTYAEALATHKHNAPTTFTQAETRGTSSTSSPYLQGLRNAFQPGQPAKQPSPMSPPATFPMNMPPRGQTFPKGPMNMPPQRLVFPSTSGPVPKREYGEIQSPLSPTKADRAYPLLKRPRNDSSQFPDNRVAPGSGEQAVRHYASAVNALDTDVVETYKKYLMDRNKINQKNRNQNAERGNVSRGPLFDMDKLVEHVETIIDFLKTDSPDVLLMAKANEAFDEISSHIRKPRASTGDPAVVEMRTQVEKVKALQMRENRPDAVIANDVKQSEVDWNGLVFEQKPSGSGQLELDGLSRTMDNLSMTEEVSLTQARGASYADILGRNFTQSSFLKSPINSGRFEGGERLTIVKEEEREGVIPGTDQKREVMGASGRKNLSSRAYLKMKSAWNVWKETFREKLPEIQQVYEEPSPLKGKGKQKQKLTYSETNPVAFFSQVVIDGRIVYQKSDGVGSTQQAFTVEDLICAMDPQFKEFGHAFLQQEWRATEGQSWASAKKYRPGESIAPGDQRIDGQHEWLPTAKATKILHTILQKYSKQEQLAWISALDILRTPTSDVAINFTWNPAINVADVNAHPEHYTTSQIGIWEHHSAGMYNPQQQLNKGNGPFHDRINKLIDASLSSDESQLLELLENLRDFVGKNMYGGELPHNLGLRIDAMKRIKNDLTRQSQKTYAPQAERYGRYEHTSQMAEVRYENENETIGTLSFKEAQNFGELLHSLKETKERTLEIFDRRIAALRTYSQMDISSFFKSRSFDLETDELMKQALLAPLRGHSSEELIGMWEQVYQKQVQQFGPRSSFTLYSGLMLGNLCRLKGDFQRAQPLLGDIKVIIEKQTQIAPKVQGDTYRTLAEYYMDFGQSSHALHMLRQSSKAYQQLQTGKDLTVPRGLAAPFVENQLLTAMIHLKSKEFDKAKKVLENIMSSQDKTYLVKQGDKGKTPIISARLLQLELQRQTEYRYSYSQEMKATRTAVKALNSEALKEKYLGDCAFQDGVYFFKERKNTRLAEQDLKSALEMYNKANKYRNWREIVLVHRALGDVYQELQDWGNAIRSYEMALSIHNEIGRIQHPEQADVLKQIVALYQKIGKPGEADSVFKRYMPAKIAKNTVYPLEAADLYQLSADFYRSIERPEKVEQALQNAFALTRARLNEGNIETRKRCQDLLNFYAGQGEHQKAVRWIERLCRMERKQRQGYLSLATIDQVADIYEQLRDYAAAKNFYLQALATPMHHSNKSGQRIYFPLRDSPRHAVFYNRKIQECDLKIANQSVAARHQGPLIQ